MVSWSNHWNGLRSYVSAALEPFDILLCGCQVAEHANAPIRLMTLFSSRPKRDLLLCVARHTAVTLTRNAPLSKAPSPGISVSRVEPSGVFVSRFCPSSSRSLGRCLLLGQRSQMNFFSHHIGSLFHQDHGNPNTEFSRHCHNGHPRALGARMSVANRAKKIPELTVLSDRRPGSLDHFTSQPFISGVGDRSPIGSLSCTTAAQTGVYESRHIEKSAAQCRRSYSQGGESEGHEP